MANKTMRFLSLLLALVMVIGMMPMGQARAEESAAPVISAAAKVVGGSYVSLADCEYTFEKTGDTVTKENDPAEDDTADSWYISSWVGGTQYYVYAHAGLGEAQKPTRTGKREVGISDLDSPEGSVLFLMRAVTFTSMLMPATVATTSIGTSVRVTPAVIRIV